jgi:hypothetical protein
MWLAAVGAIYVLGKRGFRKFYDYQGNVLLTILYVSKTGFMFLRDDSYRAASSRSFDKNGFNPFFTDFIIVFMHFSNGCLSRSYRFSLFIAFQISWVHLGNRRPSWL